MLFIRDLAGQYVVAPQEVVLKEARDIAGFYLRRGVKMASADVAKRYFESKLQGREVEVFVCLYLDANNRIIQYTEPFSGTINQSRIYPRVIVKAAIKCNAAALIIAHNHPSGNLEISEADRALTTKLRLILSMIDVSLIDHIIVADGAVSFADEGLLEKAKG